MCSQIFSSMEICIETEILEQEQSGVKRAAGDCRDGSNSSKKRARVSRGTSLSQRVLVRFYRNIVRGHTTAGIAAAFTLLGFSLEQCKGMRCAANVVCNVILSDVSNKIPMHIVCAMA